MTDWTVQLGANQYLLTRSNETSTNQAANTSVVQTLVYLIRDAGTGAWSNYTNNSWSSNTNGNTAGGSGTYDLRGSGTLLLLNNSWTIAHDPSTGAKSISVSGAFSDPHGTVGSGSAGGTLVLSTLPQVPGAPALNLIDQITASGARANYTAPASVGGSAISAYTTQFSTDPTFNTGVTTVAGDAAADPVSATGLTPSALYNVRTAAINTQGTGPWSGVLTFTTAAAGAPHIAAIPKWDNSGIFVVLDNPFNTSGASFTVTRTVSGPGAPVPVTINVPASTPCFDPLVLAPGQVATYRATATIGGATTGSSPSVSVAYSAVTVAAPVPPIFDGSMAIPAPLGDTLTSAWQGSPNVSTSLIFGKHPMGWRNFDQGANGLATGVVTQIDDTLATNSGNGQFDVMAVFGSTQSAAGVRVGTEVLHPTLMAQVFGSVVYYGSILVEVDVATKLAAEIEWYASNGNLIGRSVGATVSVSANTPTTLSVSGTAPPTAVYAAVDSVDIGGSGWAAGSIRFAGSAMLSASASYPYFDGDTTDTTQYNYTWQGAENASSSLRVSLAASGSSNSLQDPDDPVIPAAPTPPVVDDSQILTDVVWRRYVAAIPQTSIRQWLISVPTLALYTGANAERQVRVRYWKNPNNIDPSVWTDAGSTYDAEQIISYIPPNVQFVLDGVDESAYVNFPASLTQDASTVDANHLLFGSDGVVVWPELDCGVGYILTLDVPLTSTPGNITQVLELTDRIG